MAFRDTYRAQVALLTRILPLIAEEACFALKGGTAINLFIRDMPRLSVDIDLTYVPVAPRAASLAQIDAAMTRAPIVVNARVGNDLKRPPCLQAMQCSSSPPRRVSPSIP
jgi:Nucleotidyl transferase AbiEii toxin, Type IV TA system